MIKHIIHKMKNIVKFIKSESGKNIYKPLYKLVDILETDGQHVAVIKLLNKNVTFNATPEEILANDNLVDQFSPRDIRALTYLGYLGINSPKYKILARKLCENEKINFIIQKKGEKKVVIKTAAEIVSESNFISDMNSEDAKTVGYTMAIEAVSEEKRQKEALLDEIKHSKSKDK